MKFEERWTEVKGWRVHVVRSPRRAEKGRLPVVLVHGLSVSHRYWMPTAEVLAQHYDVYIPDLPGFGDSEKPDRILTIPELTGVLADLLEQTGLERAILAGNSMGCQIIVHLAAARPELVAAAVLTGPATDPQWRSVTGQLWRGTLDIVREPLALLAILAGDYLRAGMRRSLRTLQYSIQDTIEELLPEIQAPVLVVRGQQDRITSHRWVQQIANRLPDGRLVTIPGAAHGLVYSAGPELSAAIHSFMRQVTGSNRSGL